MDNTVEYESDRIFKQTLKSMIDKQIYSIRQEIIFNSCDDILDIFNLKIKLQDSKLNRTKFESRFKSKVLKILESERFNNRVANLFSGAGGIITGIVSQKVLNLLQESENLDYSTILACLEEITDVSELKKLIYTELYMEIMKVDFIASNVQYQTKIEVKIKRLYEKLLKGKDITMIFEVGGYIAKAISFVMDVLDKIHSRHKSEILSGGYAY